MALARSEENLVLHEASRREFLCGVGASLLVGGCASSPFSPDDRYVRAENALKEQIEAGMIDGAVFTTTDDERFFSVGDRRTAPRRVPMSADTLFDVASLTKPVVAACAALLYADGKLDPAAPFVRYLPDHSAGLGCGITVTDLATHTSGFRYLMADGSDEARFRRDMLSHLPAEPRGERFRYCCYNYILLGMIVECISGLRLDRFARSRLFGPLSMRHSKWGPTDDPKTVAFRHARPGMAFAPPGRIVDRIARTCAFPIGNAGLFTTAGDLRLFAEDILARRTFPAAYYDLMLTCATNGGDARRSFGWDMRASRRPSGCSDRTILHTGSTGQTLVIDPVRNRAVVLLTARRGGHDEAIAGRRHVCEILLGCGTNGVKM